MQDWEVNFYIDSEGNSPVEEFIRNLPEKEQLKLIYTIRLLQASGINLREPHARKIQSETNLFELRSKFRSNIQKVFYFHFTGKTFVMLHAFTKKTQKTPANEIKIAVKRKDDYIRRFNDGQTL